MRGKTEHVPNQPKTPQRAIRIADDLWSQAKAVAKERGEHVSDIVRDALVEYVRKYGKK